VTAALLQNGAPARSQGDGDSVARARFTIAMLAFLGVTGLMLYLMGVNPDVGWFLEIVRHGERPRDLYVDAPGAALEVNPPLALWLLIPVVRLAAALGLPIAAAPAMLVVAVAFIGIGLSAAVLNRAVARSARRQSLWLLAVAGLWLPAHDYAQREHQVVLLLAPMLFASVVAPTGVKLGRRTQVGIGLAGGLGVALKPHFAVAWLLVELTMAVFDRTPRRLVRLESCVAAAVVVTYALAVVLLTPEYLRLVQVWGPLYLRMKVKPIAHLLLTPDAISAMVALALAWPCRRMGFEARTAVTFAIAANAFLVAVLIQHKGFNYHYFPVFAFAWVSMACSAWVLWRASKPRPVRLLVIAASMGMLFLTLERLAVGLVLGQESRRLHAAYRAAVAGPTKDVGRGFGVLSTNLVHAFPMATQLGLGWPLRVPSLWVLETVAPTGCTKADGNSRSIERHFIDGLWEDLVRAKPAVLVVAPLPREMQPRPGCTTMADHLARDLRFVALFAEYSVVDTIPRVVHGPFTVLRRRQTSPNDSAQSSARIRATSLATTRGFGFRATGGEPQSSVDAAP
jgi:hypothetical protein